MQPTRFMSNSPHMLMHLGRRCEKSHKHHPLEGGRRVDAAFCTLPLIQATLRWMHDTTKADEHERETNSENMRHVAAMMFVASKDKPERGESVSIGKTKMQKAGGGETELDLNTIKFKTQCFDECTGEPLPNHLVRAAMIEGVSYFSEKAVWASSDWADMK